MNFEILDRIRHRVKTDLDDSDFTGFFSLMYMGEMLTKLICASLIAGIDEDPKKHKYSQLYKLVRADGVGDWSKAIEEVVSGPTSHYLSFDAKECQRLLSQKLKVGSWQYDSTKLIHDCLLLVEDSYDEKLPTKVAGKQWFEFFARLRNATRGHGAQKPSVVAKVIPKLRDSIELVAINFPLLKKQWAFLYQNMSGKYRVTKISSDTSSFSYLTKNEGKKYHYKPGVYIFLNNTPTYVQLIKSDADITDFYFPNGGFTSKRYEVLSYITGDKDSRDSSPYLMPAGDLPISQTQGLDKLDVLGRCLSNVPQIGSLYITRSELENNVRNVLLNERHPVITLLGRGGIGKTSLALRVLRDLCEEVRFDIILWFSSRDIDLLEEGAKSVQPQILDIKDVAREFVRLVDEKKLEDKSFDAKSYFEKQIGKSDIGDMLIVFDNFETVKNPLEMFAWLDTHIRNPNKILITSRIREFKADYPITVGGMKEEEFKELTDNIAERLQIKDLLDDKYLTKLYDESGGHPYVAKVLLGVVAKEKKAGTIDRIVASEDELLQALFERTYGDLSQAARKVFLTLSSWRSTIPKVGLEAVLMGTSDSKIDVELAIQELYSYSFIDLHNSDSNENIIISLPLSSFMFGKRKLSVSPFKQSILETRNILMMMGVGKLSSVDEGAEDRFKQFFSNVARELQRRGGKKLDFFQPILQYICRKHPIIWLSYASLMEEIKRYDDAIEACKNYLENEDVEDKKIAVWKKLSVLYHKTKNYIGEIHSLVEMSEIGSTSDAAVSSTLYKLNSLLSDGKLDSSKDDRDAIIDRMISLAKNRFEFRNTYFDEYSKIAWLFIHTQRINDARKIIKKILKEQPDHLYANKLTKTIKM